jgi:hypothetical protein
MVGDMYLPVANPEKKNRRVNNWVRKMIFFIWS